jgi:hypothetical protein
MNRRRHANINSDWVKTRNDFLLIERRHALSLHFLFKILEDLIVSTGESGSVTVFQDDVHTLHDTHLMEGDKRKAGVCWEGEEDKKKESTPPQYQRP